jgi:hypothetical protein
LRLKIKTYERQASSGQEYDFFHKNSFSGMNCFYRQEPTTLEAADKLKQVLVVDRAVVAIEALALETCWDEGSCQFVVAVEN